MKALRIPCRDAGPRARPSPRRLGRRPAVAMFGDVLAAGAISAALLVLPGCTTTRPQKLPGGGAGLIVDCSGASLTWTHCFREAGEKCPHGYEIVKRGSKGGGGRLVSGDFLQVFGNKADHRKLLIRCKAADSADAPATADGAPSPRRT